MANEQSIKQTELNNFGTLLADVKSRIQTAQTRAMLAVNSELVRLYWDIGRIIDARQQQEGWGTGVIPRLAAELKNELPEVKGFSERNIGRMIAFNREYPNPSSIVQQPVAQLEGTDYESTQLFSNQGVTILPQPVAKLDTDAKAPQPAAILSDSLLEGWA